MIIKSAVFVKSSAVADKCPEATLPEYAFIGRSNVGKSSLINMIANNSSMAKTSSTPGKTQLINHFIVNDKWYIVDLPGIGYAKTSKEKRNKWEQMITHYLVTRSNLINTYVLIDSRLSPQKIDVEFINWMGEKQLPFTILFTKTDKNSKNELAKSLKAFEEEILKTWSELPPMILTSAVKKLGRDEILEQITENNKVYLEATKDK